MARSLLAFIWFPFFLLQVPGGSSIQTTGYENDKTTIEPIADSKQWKEIPVLCYHQVRERNGNDSKNARPYIIPVQRFAQHMQMLHDSGYRAILPEDIVNYHLHGNRLPQKPVILSFDDGTISQYTNALPILNRYSFKAVFFIMTVSLNKKNYMSDAQVKELSGNGHIIGCHTWDHKKVTLYYSADWITQLVKPTRRLEQITGQSIKYFAYPFGVWDTAAVTQLKKNGFEAAFQLSDRRYPNAPLLTARRIIADGDWSSKQLHAAITRSFR